MRRKDQRRHITVQPCQLRQQLPVFTDHESQPFSLTTCTPLIGSFTWSAPRAGELPQLVGGGTTSHGLKPGPGAWRYCIRCNALCVIDYTLLPAVAG
ncbi:MAG: hypothetical protein ACRDTG_22485 [Pseudonocardiaceae bacterium]